MIEAIWSAPLWIFFPLAVFGSAFVGIVVGKVIAGDYDVPHVPVIAPSWFFIKRRIMTPVLTRLGLY